MEIRRMKNNMLGRNVLVIGCGALGSHTAIQLAKMGCHEFTLVDFDIVERHNLNNQAYTKEDIGKLKIEALKEHIKYINPDAFVNISNLPIEEVTLDLSKITDIVIAVDSHSVRKYIIERFPDTPKCEGRMSLNTGYATYFDKPTQFYLAMLDMVTDTSKEVSACGLPLNCGNISTIVSGYMATLIVKNMLNKQFGVDFEEEEMEMI
jgi:tRNA A37 threonylcarbamoyladenosine dehydratase